MANAELLAQLQDQIDALSSTTPLSDLMLLSAAIDNATADRIISVATVSALPDLKLGNTQYGTIFFVESINIPVIAGTKSWLGLDGRLVRSDAPSSAIWSWGCNNAGMLGDNSTTDKSSPISIIGGFTDWIKISASNLFQTGLKWDGSVWSWGCNNVGALGDGNTTNKSSPVSLSGGFTDWCAICNGASNGFGVKRNGTIWSWGNGANGRLGTNNVTASCSPVSIAGGFNDWCDISAKGYHTVAIKDNGTIWSWGENVGGKLGDGTTVNKSSPVSVVGGFADWQKISASIVSTGGIRSNGTIWTWGCNNSGQLGNGTTVNRCSPVSLVGGFADWSQISMGVSHSMAIRSNGTLWSWGAGVNGRLGDGTVANKSSPVSVIGGFTDWCEMNAGSNSSSAIRTNGTMWTWGLNFCGILGDGTTVAKSSPISVVGGFTDWNQVDSGTSSIIALRKF